jgi:hypothetical protein
MHDDQRICPVKYLVNNGAKIRFSANKNWLQDSKISLVFEPEISNSHNDGSQNYCFLRRDTGVVGYTSISELEEFPSKIFYLLI